MNPILSHLQQKNLLDETSVHRISQSEKAHPYSIHWHVRIVLYLGVSLVAGGFGILIYKHIDTIGHAAIVALTAVLSASCFFYCIRILPAFNRNKMESPGIGYDYILLLGCLLFLTFLGYLQWQYEVFGARYGLATFVPAAILLPVAYRFDHLGVLTLGITLFASWAGLTITPLQILENNDFSEVRIIFTGAALALLFATLAWLHQRQEFKSHFSFTYANFAMHLAGVSCLAGMVTHLELLWAPLLGAAVFGMYRYALYEKSFYVLLMAVLYGYAAASFLFSSHIFSLLPGELAVYVLFGYYIGGSIWLIQFLKRSRKTLQADAVL